MGGAQSTTIPPKSDLNDYIHEGKYYIGADGVTVTNKPTDSNGFALIVVYNGSYGGIGVTQFFIPYNDWRVYMRFYSYVPAKWSAWETVVKPIK